jgi:hypothetical protein
MIPRGYDAGESWLEGIRDHTLLIAGMIAMKFFARLGAIACLTLLVGAIFFQALIIAEHSQKNSDTVLNYLEAKDMLSGNHFLAGWHVPKHSYYVTDTLPIFAFMSIFGCNIRVLDIIPAIILVGLAIFAALSSVRKESSLFRNSIAVALALVGIAFIPDISASRQPCR